MKIDSEIYHPTHPKHRLKLEYTETPFYCNGCKEAGIGLKYTCQACDVDLHRSCALAPQVITHPFYNKCYFEFRYSPPGPILRVCDACHNQVRGFVYNCRSCDFDLHPCCANLPNVLDGGDCTLYLCDKVSGPCHCCGGKGRGWSYMSRCKTYNLHVSCVKKAVMECWEAAYFNVDKRKLRELQGRVPSLKGTLRNHHRGKGGKLKKCCQIAGSAVNFVVSAILGDPTTLIASVVAGFISN